MGFFKKLFTNSKSDGPVAPAPKQEEKKQPVEPDDITRFQEAFIKTGARYISLPGRNLGIELPDEVTGETLPYAKAFPQVFEEWKAIQSVADQRSAIYRLLDEFIGGNMDHWQVIERLTDDRYPQKALVYFNENVTLEESADAYIWAALAKANIVLTNYGEAEKNALKALEIDETLTRAKIQLADVYHLTNRQAASHRLYEEILKARLPKEPATLSIQQLLGFEGDILFSPVYAVGWLDSVKEHQDRLWEWAGEEFYFSPHFRAQHAYYLIRKNEQMKGFAKLLILSREMPWFKEAVLNTYNLIGQLQLTNEMGDEIARLNKIIESNNWDTSNMHTYTV